MQWERGRFLGACYFSRKAAAGNPARNCRRIAALGRGTRASPSPREAVGRVDRLGKAKAIGVGEHHAAGCCAPRHPPRRAVARGREKCVCGQP